jgi:peptidoglycan-N-acetylglucosamine deacetylase
MRLFRPGIIACWLYPGAVFRVKTAERILYLTFDDGPDPDSTINLLEILHKCNVRATFFCCGTSAEKFPDLINLIKSEGHVIGNHGYRHYDGWITPFKHYIEDVQKADEYTSSVIFRPPYGHIGFLQFRELRKRYKIVFWDLMPYDFDDGWDSNKSLRILKRKIRPGSVIVLHDRSGSSSSLFLEEFIHFAMQEGYNFDNNL